MFDPRTSMNSNDIDLDSIFDIKESEFPTKLFVENSSPIMMMPYEDSFPEEKNHVELEKRILSLVLICRMCNSLATMIVSFLLLYC